MNRAPETARASTVQTLLVAVASTVIVVVRLALGEDSLHTIWAEDGAVFLQDALHRPLQSLVDPYNGYGLFLQRALAELGHVVPVEHWSTLTLTTAAVATGLASAVVFRNARTIGLVMLPAVLAALVPALLPGYGISMIGSWNHLQWVLAYALAWLLLSPIGGRGRVLPAAFAAVTVACGVPGVLVCPLVLVHGRRWYRHPAVPGMVLGALYQVVVRFTATASRSPGVPRPLAFARETGRAVIESGGGPLTGRVFYVGVVLVLLAAVAAVLSPNRRPAVALLAGAAFAAVTLSVFNDGVFEPRYGVFTASLVVAAVLVGYGTADAWRPGYSWVVLATCAVWVVALPPSSYRGTGPHWDRSVERARAECAHERGDTEVALPSAPVGWSVALRCDDLS